MVFTKDISAGGLLFTYDCDIPAGTVIDLKINFALNQPQILCSGQVMRSLAKGRPTVYEIAVRFLTLRKSEGDLINESAEKFYED